LVAAYKQSVQLQRRTENAEHRAIESEQHVAESEQHVAELDQRVAESKQRVAELDSVLDATSASFQELRPRLAVHYVVPKPTACWISSKFISPNSR
jgi:uncharacterized coiled-coil protein SlyX